MNISSPGVSPAPPHFCQNPNSRQPPPARPPSRVPQCKMSNMYRDGGQQICACTAAPADVLLNDQLVDCSITFSVDRNVCIYGVVVPTQIRPIAIQSPGPQDHLSSAGKSLGLLILLNFVIFRDIVLI